MSHLNPEHFSNRAGRRPGQAGTAAVPVADVLKHLGDSLRTQGRRYRKRLKRCQKHFSEDAVHASRVETRRLLATIELLGAFIPEHDLRKARRALKHHLETFGELRDTQVQLVYVGRMAGTFPDAQAFYDWLRDRKSPLHPANPQGRQTPPDEASGPAPRSV